MLFGFRVSPDRFCIGEHQLLLMLCELLRIFQRLHLPKAGGKIGVWHVGAIEQMRLVHVSQQQFQLLLVGVSGFKPEASWSRRLVGYFYRTFLGVSASFRSENFTAASFPARIIPLDFSAFGSRFGSDQKASGAETAPL